jgi:ABC-2 type transport system ATP-binding protein
MKLAIRTEKLSRRFGKTVAVDSVDLEVPEGAIYALVGANGAGKTTIIKMLMNIFRPSDGHAEVLGTDASHLAGKGFTRIGYVSENQEMPEWMTTGGMLSYYRSFYPEWDPALEEQLVRQGSALGRRPNSSLDGIKSMLFDCRFRLLARGIW